MGLEYKEKNGTVLKGFSQIDLEKLNANLIVNNQLLKKLFYVSVTGLVFTMMVIVWLLWQMKRYKIITYLIQSLR